MIRSLSFMLLATTLTATTAPAQTLDVPVQSNVLSINPFGFLLEWYNAEYEHAFSSTSSWSVGIGHLSFGDDGEGDQRTYTSGDLKLRYYPSAEAPTKFSAGIAFGYSHVTDEDFEFGGAVTESEFDALSAD